MRIHYMSDLHLEFGQHTIDLPDGDVLVLAGDITVARTLDPSKTDVRSQRTQTRTRALFDRARRNFDRVLYIAGNHEHYGGDIYTTGEILAEHVANGNVQFCENSAVEINGVTFLCCTLWTDMDRRDPDTLRNVDRGLTDFFVVSAGKRRFSSQLAADIHDQSLQWLRSELAARSGQPVVVVTHHAPSYRGLAPQFAYSELNGGFASNIEHVTADNPNMVAWIFGHTHVRTRFRIRNTMFRANCAGYPGTDLDGFDPDTWFEV
ncbi:MAG: metallophosphoesterase [Pseudomonadota bacterium]